MTTVFTADRQVNAAIRGTHVFIMGVGSYPHLLGGTEKLAFNPMGLGQLTSPPVSAKAFADWFLARQLNPSSQNGFNNPEIPLASVEMLLSPAGTYSRPDGTQLDVALATMTNIRNGFTAWYERVKACTGSIGVLYFCGHGVMAENDYLLAADFGANRENPWGQAFDISLTARALRREIPGPLYFFIDACRQIPRELLLSLGATPSPLMAVRLEKPVVNTSRLILEAAVEGLPAFGRLEQVSRFTAALIQSLSGFAGRKVPGQERWAVTGEDIYRTMLQILADDKLPDAVRQYSEAQLVGPITFHVETTPPRDYIELNLALWEYLRETHGAVSGTSAWVSPTKAETKVAIVPEKGLRIFISCSEVDLQVGRKLYSDLTREGYRPWLFQESLLPGQDWKATTDKALRTSCSSRYSLRSQSQGAAISKKNLERQLKYSSRCPLHQFSLSPYGSMNVIPRKKHFARFSGLTSSLTTMLAWKESYEPSPRSMLRNRCIEPRRPERLWMQFRRIASLDGLLSLEEAVTLSDRERVHLSASSLRS